MQENKEQLNIGISENLVAAAAWLVPFVAIVLVFVEKKNKFVKFHAWQALAWTGLTFLIGSAVGNIPDIYGWVIPTAFEFSVTLLKLLFGAASILLYFINILGAIKALQYEKWEMPIIGGFVKENIKGIL